MKILPIILSILLLFASCEERMISEKQAEKFIKFFGFSGNDIGNKVYETTEGDIVIVGTATVDDNTDLLIIKTDKYGNEKWLKTFGDSLDNTGNSFCVSENGEIYAVGSSYDSLGYSNFYIVKVSSTGDFIWEKSIGKKYNDVANAIIQMPDNNLCVVGNTITSAEYNIDSTDILMITLNTEGDSIWSRSFGGNLYDSGNDVVKKDDNSFIIVGSTKSFATNDQDNSNILVIETNSLGQLKGMETYGGVANDYGNSITGSNEEGFFIAGTSHSLGTDKSNAFVFKLSPETLSVVWMSNYGGRNNDTGEDIVVSDTNLYVSGIYEDENTGNKNAYLLHLNAKGTELNSKNYGSDGAEIFKSLAATSDEGVILTGSSVFEENGMVTLIKILPKNNIY